MNKISKIVALVVIAAIIATSVPGIANAFYLGQRGQEVADLQFTLIEAGFDIPAISSGVAKAGYFGVQTRSALDAYETSKTPSLKLGAVPSRDITENDFSFGGVRFWGERKAFASTIDGNTATSTNCIIATPNATSSVLFASYTFHSSIASSSVAVIGWGATRFATTTKLTGATDIVIPSGVGGSVTASSTAASFVVPPSSFINFRNGGGFTTAPGGTCEVVFVIR